MIEHLKILILEDNPQDAEMLIWNLTKAEVVFTSKIVETKEAFISELDGFIPDIILSDFSLPNFSGAEAFHIKQSKYPEIPFIIVSSTIGEENAVEFIKSGVSDYALKDKLFTLPQKIIRALKEASEKKEKAIADERVNKQHEKLMEIAFLQSHQVRALIVSILGLTNLFNFNDPYDPINIEVIQHLQKTTLDFDKIIHKIVHLTDEIKAL
jgi:DNA-binding NtrC family response regulator